MGEIPQKRLAERSEKCKGMTNKQEQVTESVERRTVKGEYIDFRPLHLAGESKIAR